MKLTVRRACLCVPTPTPITSTSQRALEKSGFVRCGRIYTEDGSPRWAYYHKAATQRLWLSAGKRSGAAFRCSKAASATTRNRAAEGCHSSALGQSLGHLPQGEGFLILGNTA